MLINALATLVHMIFPPFGRLDVLSGFYIDVLFLVAMYPVSSLMMPSAINDIKGALMRRMVRSNLRCGTVVESGSSGAFGGKAGSSSLPENGPRCQAPQDPTTYRVIKGTSLMIEECSRYYR